MSKDSQNIVTIHIVNRSQIKEIAQLLELKISVLKRITQFY